MKAIHIKPLTPSVSTPHQHAHTHTHTVTHSHIHRHRHKHSRYSIQALHNPVRQMDRLQTHTDTASKRRSGRAVEGAEKGSRWFTRERRGLNFISLSPSSPSLPPILFQNKCTILILREIPSVRATAPFTPVGLHLGPFTQCVCACAYVCMPVGERKRGLV